MASLFTHEIIKKNESKYINKLREREREKIVTYLYTARAVYDQSFFGMGYNYIVYVHNRAKYDLYGNTQIRNTFG